MQIKNSRSLPIFALTFWVMRDWCGAMAGGLFPSDWNTQVWIVPFQGKVKQLLSGGGDWDDWRWHLAGWHSLSL